MHLACECWTQIRKHDAKISGWVMTSNFCSGFGPNCSTQIWWRVSPNLLHHTRLSLQVGLDMAFDDLKITPTLPRSPYAIRLDVITAWCVHRTVGDVYVTQRRSSTSIPYYVVVVHFATPNHLTCLLFKAKQTKVPLENKPENVKWTYGQSLIKQSSTMSIVHVPICDVASK